uniref:Secreted protein n=1 Tax=Phaeocystis antarctica TaxID=33657 RepID=A0A7S0H8Q6_9EUKA
MLAAGWCWCLSVVNGSIVVLLAQPSSLAVLVLVCEVGCAGWHALQRQPAAPADVACSASGFGQLVLHVENGLLEIFLAVCGSSTPASSCQDERRQHDELCRCCCCAAAWPSRARAAPAPQLACTRTPA